jgi:hypothetical protein
MLARLLLSLILATGHAREAESAGGLLMSSTLATVGGEDKLLRVLRTQEQFHSEKKTGKAWTHDDILNIKRLEKLSAMWGVTRNISQHIAGSLVP